MVKFLWNIPALGESSFSSEISDGFGGFRLQVESSRFEKMIAWKLREEGVEKAGDKSISLGI
jgi:hypothetical protein